MYFINRIIVPGRQVLRWPKYTQAHGLWWRSLSTSSLGKLGAAFDTKQQPKVELGWWKENEVRRLVNELFVCSSSLFSIICILVMKIRSIY